MIRGIAAFVLPILAPVVAHAGTALTQPAPALGEAGLIVLGVGLAGIGVAYLRKR
jgi:hypothetical protein